MKRKTLETAVIAAALAASLLTGCSKPAEETTAAAEKQESKADAGQEKKGSCLICQVIWNKNGSLFRNRV